MIADPMIGESTLPDLPCPTKGRAEGVRIAALDELNGVFECDVVRGSQQEVNVFGHNNKGVELIASFASVSVESLQQEGRIVLDYKEPSTLPCRERCEISSGRGDESSRLQERTSAAKAAIFRLA